MAFYHVLIQIEGEKRKKLLYKDLGEKDLKKKFVKKFKKQRDHLLKNKIINHKAINEFQIVKTKEVHEKEMVEIVKDWKVKNAKMVENGILGYPIPRDHDIIRAGEDVTKNFIKEVPDDEEHVFFKIIKHPLFVALITFLLTWYFLGE